MISPPPIFLEEDSKRYKWIKWLCDGQSTEDIAKKIGIPEKHIKERILKTAKSAGLPSDLSVYPVMHDRIMRNLDIWCLYRKKITDIECEMRRKLVDLDK